MKTTKKTSAAKRLEKLKLNKTSIAYKIASELLELPNFKKTGMISNDIIFPVFCIGYERFAKNIKIILEVQELLKKIGIDTTLENFYPRGGLTGNRLIITTKLL